MTIKVAITNQDTSPNRGIRIKRQGQVVAELLAGEASTEHVWNEADLTIEEFTLQLATLKDPA